MADPVGGDGDSTTDLRKELLVRMTMLALTLAACGTSTPTPPQAAPVAAPALSPTLAAFLESPFWFGRSDHSPFGPMPYGLMARRDGDRLVLRGDVPDGLGLPPGAYQQFTFSPGAKTSLAFETSLTGEIVTGTMLEVTQTADAITFCMAPTEGGCDEMTVTLTRLPRGIAFETQRERGPHHRVVLVATQP